jgi:hypothetical protein
MALHEQCIGATDEWYTPPRVFDALGVRFDTDVASPGKRKTPWIPATRFIQAKALDLDWTEFGFVWMNPPFGSRNAMVPWKSSSSTATASHSRQIGRRHRGGSGLHRRRMRSCSWPRS